MKYTMKHKIATATITAAMMFGSLTVLPSPAAHAAQSAEVTWGVNMRTAPSTTGNVIRMLQKGEQISIIGNAASGWYKISDASGKVGYISSSSKYTELNASSSGSASGGTSSQATAASTSVGTIQKSVSFREGASTSADRIRYLKAGEKVQVTGQPSSYWYEVVDASGVKGYVSSQSQYIKVSSGTINTGTTDSGSSSTGGSTSTPSTGTGTPSASTNASVEKVIAAGMKYLGTPYEFGSNRSTTTTFDCSDFVRQAFKDALGITLPADSRQQGAYVKNKGNYTTNINNLKRGDLMFFMSYKGSSASSYSGLNKQSQRITHVGIYLGDGKILHTYSNESGGVTTGTVTGKHWEHRFIFGGSAL